MSILPFTGDSNSQGKKKVHAMRIESFDGVKLVLKQKEDGPISCYFDNETEPSATVWKVLGAGGSRHIRVSRVLSLNFGVINRGDEIFLRKNIRDQGFALVVKDAEEIKES